MKLSVVLLFFVIFPACTSQEVPDTESRMQIPELIRIPDADNPQSQSVQANPQHANPQQANPEQANPEQTNPQTNSEAIHVSRENAITRVVRQSSDAIVTVKFHSDNSFSNRNPQHAGKNPTKRAGFFVSAEGHVVTKYRYNIDPATDISVHTLGGTSHQAQIIGSDPFSGITLLKVDTGEEQPYISFGNSDSVMVGEWSIALGVPDVESRMESLPSVSAGVVNALSCMIEYPAFSETIYPDMIRTDAVVTSGSEGGPMMNANGKVIGLNTYIPSENGNNGTYGHGYAIPGNKVARVVNHLADGSNMALNYNVGIEMIPVTKTIADRYSLPVQQGLFVLGVNKDGPAYEGGILPGDVIVNIGNEIIYGDTHAWAVLRRYDKGEMMPLTIMRDDMKLETQIVLRKRLKQIENESD